MIRQRIIFLFIVLSLLLVSCNAFTPTSEATITPIKEKELTINFMHLWSEELYASRYNVINNIVNTYMNEHPHININVEILDNEQYKDKMKIVSTSNSLPDVGVTWPAGYLQPYVKGQLLAPLDNVITEELEKSFIKGTIDPYKINKVTYGLPLEFNITPIFYNKEIFKKYNLSEPSTYDDFIHIIEVLNEKGVTPIALGNKDRWTGSMWYLYLVERIVGPQSLLRVLSGNQNFTKNEGLLRAADEIQHLVQLQAFNKNFNGIENDDAKQQFYNGTAAMYMMGTWELGNIIFNSAISQDFKDKVGFFNFPYKPFEKGSMNSWVGGPGVGLYVAENSPVKEEAKQFVTYFIKEWGKMSVEQAGVIPATKVEVLNMKLPQLYIDIIEEIKRANSMVLYADVLLEPEDAEQHLSQIQALFSLATTSEQFNDLHNQFIYEKKKAIIPLE